MTDFRALCAELTEFVARLTKHYCKPAELLTRARAALANEPAVSNPPGPTDQDLLRLYKVATPCYKVEEYKRELDFARAVLARWGNPAPLADTHYEWELEDAEFARAALARWGKPAPLADTHYEWELEDAEGEWQAGGSSNSQSDVEREGIRYLHTFAQDGPHKLIIRQHTTQTINEITYG